MNLIFRRFSASSSSVGIPTSMTSTGEKCDARQEVPVVIDPNPVPIMDEPKSVFWAFFISLPFSEPIYSFLARPSSTFMRASRSFWASSFGTLGSANAIFLNNSHGNSGHCPQCAKWCVVSQQAYTGHTVALINCAQNTFPLILLQPAHSFPRYLQGKQLTPHIVLASFCCFMVLNHFFA